jgi:hypothetical protein
MRQVESLMKKKRTNGPLRWRRKTATFDAPAIGFRSCQRAAGAGRRGVTLPWANGKNGKEYRAAMGRKPIVGLFSVGLEEPYRWKDSVQSDAEIRIWTLDGIANGLRPWFSKFGGVLHDPRWLKVVEDIFTWHKKAEHYLRHQTPLARVALVYSQQTAWFYGGSRAEAKVEDHTLGWYQALIEARVPFEMVHDRLLDPAQISQFKTLILPNIAALSDAQCGQFRDFVKKGGSLIVTYETSLYDEWGVRRKDFDSPTFLALVGVVKSKDPCKTLISASNTRPFRITRCSKGWKTRPASSTASRA